MARVQEIEMTRLVHTNGATVTVPADDASKYVATGVFVTEDGSAVTVPVGDGSGGDMSYEDMEYEEMTVPQLKEYAGQREVDISGLTRKGDIIDALAAADEAADTGE